MSKPNYCEAISTFIDESFVGKIIKSLQKRSDQKYRAKEISDLCVGLTTQQAFVIKPLLENQQNQFDAERAYAYSPTQPSSRKKYRADRKLMLTIVQKSLLGLRDTFQIVGVQPLRGPVGLVYTLQYVDHSDTISGVDGSETKKRVSLEVLSNAVEAGSRKLQAGWTIEAMQDVHAVHGINLEEEITSALASEVSYEISNEIVSDLVDIAKKTKPTKFSTASATEFDKKLHLAITHASLEIARTTRRGAGNIIVTTPMGVSLLQSSKKFDFTPATTDTGNFGTGVGFVGTLAPANEAPTYKVFNTLAPALSTTDGSFETQFLIGFKGGNGDTDAGYIYCPYMPLMKTGITVNPVTFQPVQGFMTRYGKYVSKTAENYYRLVSATMNFPGKV